MAKTNQPKRPRQPLSPEQKEAARRRRENRKLAKKLQLPLPGFEVRDMPL